MTDAMKKVALLTEIAERAFSLQEAADELALWARIAGDMVGTSRESEVLGEMERKFQILKDLIVDGIDTPGILQLGQNLLGE